MSFVFFDVSKAPKTTRSSKPTLNVSKNGRIAFNRAFKDELIKDNKYVLIGYDSKNPKKIAIKLISQEDEKAFKISTNAKTGGTFINAKPFLNEIEGKVKLKENEVFRGTVEVTVEKDLLIAELPTVIEEEEEGKVKVEVNLSVDKTKLQEKVEEKA